MSTQPIPTIQAIEQIAALPDPVIRNLQITQCYHELASAMAARSGGSANWCTFATWASKQAGQTIRNEDLARTLENLLNSQIAPEQAAQDLVTAAQQGQETIKVDELIGLIWKVLDPEEAFDRSSEAVARGNLKVFAEIGREFARFCDTCLHDTAYDPESITRFCDSLRPGEPPDGQAYLRQAFLHYYQALFEADDKACIELMLLANLKIGYHEQTRLQPEINQALAAPVITPEIFTRNLLRALHPQWGWINDLIWYFMRLFGQYTAIGKTIESYRVAAQRQAQHIVTEFMMTIALPHHQILRLGDDLSIAFPPILQQVNNPDLQALLAQIDPTPDSTNASGALYWGDLPDRLHFIADMFRCYQTSADLFEPPFTAEQIKIIKDGGLPSGRL